MVLPRLIALSPSDLERERCAAFLERVSAAVAAGLPGVLLREPRLNDRDWIALAQELRARCAPGSVWLGVHDRAHLARHVGADALHLGFRSLQPGQAREVVGDLELGLSTHADDDESTRRHWNAADYLFHGPVHDTPSKHGLCAPVGFEGLERAVAAAGRPLVALGGLRPQDVEPAHRAGAHGIAVLGGILARATAEQARDATREYLAAGATAP